MSKYEFSHKFVDKAFEDSEFLGMAGVGNYQAMDQVLASLEEGVLDALADGLALVGLFEEKCLVAGALMGMTLINGYSAMELAGQIMDDFYVRLS